MREASAGTGIGIAAISATYNMTDPDPERLAAGQRAFITIYERAPSMGCHIVTVCRTNICYPAKRFSSCAFSRLKVNIRAENSHT